MHKNQTGNEEGLSRILPLLSFVMLQEWQTSETFTFRSFVAIQEFKNSNGLSEIKTWFLSPFVISLFSSYSTSLECTYSQMPRMPFHFKCGKKYEDYARRRRQCTRVSSINKSSLRTNPTLFLENKALSLCWGLLICVIWIISRSKANYHDLVNSNDFAGFCTFPAYLI